MSPVIKRRGEREPISGKYLLFGLTVVCVVLMMVTFATDLLNRPLSAAVGYVVVPFQEGIGRMGEFIANRSEELVQIRSLLEENKRLKEENAELTEKNTLLQQGQYE